MCTALKSAGGDAGYWGGAELGGEGRPGAPRYCASSRGSPGKAASSAAPPPSGSRVARTFLFSLLFFLLLPSDFHQGPEPPEPPLSAMARGPGRGRGGLRGLFRLPRIPRLRRGCAGDSLEARRSVPPRGLGEVGLLSGRCVGRNLCSPAKPIAAAGLRWLLQLVRAASVAAVLGPRRAGLGRRAPREQVRGSPAQVKAPTGRPGL